MEELYDFKVFLFNSVLKGSFETHEIVLVCYQFVS